ncbi:MAG: hypothetical protein RLP02_22850, partial [Coleofasciculus sp. C2-GNP5-27]
FIEGVEPTRFYLRLLPMHLFSTFNDSGHGSTRTAFAFFQACVTKIENFSKPDGQVIGIWEPTHQPFPNGKYPGFTTIKDDELETYFDDYEQVLEIGGVAAARHFLHKSKSPNYLQPHLST